MSKSLRVFHYPPGSKNPYLRLMCHGTAAHGSHGVLIAGGPRALVRHAAVGEGDVLHLHWISGPAIIESGFGAFARLAAFYGALLLWRLRRRKIVWTVHNLVNHEKHRVWLDRLNSMLVARLSHHILVHGETARPLVSSCFRVPISKIKVVYHGNYEGVITPQPLDLSHEGVRFLYFGAIRPYKGVVEAATTFSQLEGSHQFHIAGRVEDDKLQQAITALSARDGRISHELTFVTDDELGSLLAWCDVVVLPYRDVLTSGSLLMALTAGRPVVAPRAGLIPEYTDESCAFLYSPSEPGNLARAFREAALATDLSGKAVAARKQALKFDWDIIGEELTRIYRGEIP